MGRVGRWEWSALEEALEGVVSGQSLRCVSSATGVPMSTILVYFKRLSIPRFSGHLR